jgi:hypothetical protein
MIWPGTKAGASSLSRIRLLPSLLLLLRLLLRLRLVLGCAAPLSTVGAALPVPADAACALPVMPVSDTSVLFGAVAVGDDRVFGWAAGKLGSRSSACEASACRTGCGLLLLLAVLLVLVASLP